MVMRFKRFTMIRQSRKNPSGTSGPTWTAIRRHVQDWDPVELGIPEWLVYVAATLSEQMSKEKSQTWLLRFLEAIKPGAELERIKGPFLIMVLTSHT